MDSAKNVPSTTISIKIGTALKCSLSVKIITLIMENAQLATEDMKFREAPALSFQKRKRLVWKLIQMGNAKNVCQIITCFKGSAMTT